MTPDFTHDLFQRFMHWATEVPRRNYQFAIIDRRNRELVGYAAGQAELGIELAPRYWGRYAYAVEIGKALVDFGFRNLGLEEILGLSMSANLRVSRAFLNAPQTSHTEHLIVNALQLSRGRQ